MADPFVQEQFSAQIGSGQSLSAQVDIGGWTPVGIVVPSTWTTAGITFQASGDGGVTWGELQDETGAAVGVANVAGGTQVFIALDPAKWRGVRSIKVRSGSSGSPIVQTSAVTLTLLTRFVF